MKKIFLRLWQIEGHIRTHIAVARWLHRRIPVLGKLVSLAMDRAILCLYGIDLMSASVNVAALSIAHPVGVLLGGNGIFSSGRVVILAGVKFVARNPSNEQYLILHRQRRVFVLGDNVVIGTNTVVIGPVRICDNVIIGSMSLVNKDIDEPGIYVGTPVRKISEVVTGEWVKHL